MNRTKYRNITGSATCLRTFWSHPRGKSRFQVTALAEQIYWGSENHSRNNLSSHPPNSSGPASKYPTSSRVEDRKTRLGSSLLANKVDYRRQFKGPSWFRTKTVEYYSKYYYIKLLHVTVLRLRRDLPAAEGRAFYVWV